MSLSPAYFIKRMRIKKIPDLVDLLHLFSLESTIHQGGGKTKQEQYE